MPPSPPYTCSLCSLPLPSARSLLTHLHLLHGLRLCRDLEEREEEGEGRNMVVYRNIEEQQEEERPLALFRELQEQKNMDEERPLSLYRAYSSLLGLFTARREEERRGREEGRRTGGGGELQEAILTVLARTAQVRRLHSHVELKLSSGEESPHR